MCIVSGSVCLCYLTPFLPGVSRVAVNGNCLIHSATALRKHREPLAIFTSAIFFFFTFPPRALHFFSKNQSPPLLGVSPNNIHNTIGRKGLGGRCSLVEPSVLHAAPFKYVNLLRWRAKKCHEMWDRVAQPERPKAHIHKRLGLNLLRTQCQSCHIKVKLMKWRQNIKCSTLTY